MKQQFNNYIFYISAIAVLLAAAIHPLHWFYAPYIFAVGAAGMAITRLSRRYEGSNLRLKRLYRMESISALLIVVSSYFMFQQKNEWILFLGIAAFLQLYAAFLIPRIKED